MDLGFRILWPGAAISTVYSGERRKSSGEDQDSGPVRGALVNVDSMSENVSSEACTDRPLRCLAFGSRWKAHLSASHRGAGGAGGGWRLREDLENGNPLGRLKLAREFAGM